MAATARIIDFLRTAKPEVPCLVVDLDVVKANYKAFDRAMPGTRIFYAVKANQIGRASCRERVYSSV